MLLIKGSVSLEFSAAKAASPMKKTARPLRALAV
jgi:hypothetical protein